MAAAGVDQISLGDRSIQAKHPFRYGWIIAALSFLALFASMGIRSSFGAYVTPFETGFHTTRSTISLVSTISLIVYGLGMPVAGNLTDRFGPRRVLTWSMVFMGAGLAVSYLAQSVWQITVLYGIVASIGFALASNVTVSVAIVRWFRAKRGFVLSLAITGMAAGQMVLVPVNTLMVQSLGWRPTLLIFGLLYALLLTPLFWFLYRDDPESATVSGAADPAPGRVGPAAGRNPFAGALKLFRQPVAWMIVFAYFVCGLTDVGLIHTHLIPLVEGRGFSGQFAAGIMSLYAAVNIVATVLVGYLTDKFRPGVLLAWIYGLRAVGLTLLYFAHSPTLLVLFGLISGMTDFASIIPITALCARIYGADRMGMVLGLFTLFHQFGAAAGSLVPGLIFDWYGGYEAALLLCIGLLLGSTVVILLVREQPVRQP